GPTRRRGWVPFDEGDGKAPEFLAGLEELGERYIGEVPKSCRGWLRRPEVQGPGAGRRGRRTSKPRVAPGQPEPQTVEAIAAALPGGAWERLEIRGGAQGAPGVHLS